MRTWVLEGRSLQNEIAGGDLSTFHRVLDVLINDPTPSPVPEKVAKVTPPRHKKQRRAAKKKPPIKVSSAARDRATQGRRAVARGQRPSLKEAILTVMGDKTLHASDVHDALAAKGWLPDAADPRTYIGHVLSTLSDPQSEGDYAFERVTEKGRGYYRAASARQATSAERLDAEILQMLVQPLRLHHLRERLKLPADDLSASLGRLHAQGLVEKQARNHSVWWSVPKSS